MGIVTADHPPTVELERAGQTLVVRLNRPAALNAFEDRMLIELGLAFRSAASDASVRAVILTGAGRGFCSGADLRVGFDPETRPLGVQRRLNPVILAMSHLDKPLIAAINGPAVGWHGGFGWRPGYTWGWRGGAWGWGPAIVGGALVGAAVAGAYAAPYPYPYPYAYAPPYYAPPPGYAPAPGYAPPAYAPPR